MSAIRSWRPVIASLFAVSLAFTVTACSNSDAQTQAPDEATASQEDSAVQTVDIAADTAVGEASNASLT